MVITPESHGLKKQIFLFFFFMGHVYKWLSLYIVTSFSRPTGMCHLQCGWFLWQGARVHGKSQSLNLLPGNDTHNFCSHFCGQTCDVSTSHEWQGSGNKVLSLEWGIYDVLNSWPPWYSSLNLENMQEFSNSCIFCFFKKVFVFK